MIQICLREKKTAKVLDGFFCNINQWYLAYLKSPEQSQSSTSQTVLLPLPSVCDSNSNILEERGVGCVAKNGLYWFIAGLHYAPNILWDHTTLSWIVPYTLRRSVFTTNIFCGVWQKICQNCFPTLKHQRKSLCTTVQGKCLFSQKC